MRSPLPYLLLLVLALSACQRAAAPLPQEIYVWQRQWTPAVLDALHAARPTFSAYRVLAAETDRAGALLSAAPDLSALAATRTPVTAVLRLNGADPAPDIAALNARIRQISNDWRAAGIALQGVEIDHDCATARLPAYAQLLAAVRVAMPRELRLSITALPTWTQSPALRDVLATVDESVLQVHAVRTPAAGLFDVRAARRWVQTYAQVSPKPFRVALPAYGVRAEFDADGHALRVSAEMPRDDLGADARELEASPAQVAALLRGLERAPPANLAGVLWFRLPNAQDQRAWSLQTLRAVIDGAPLAPAFAAHVENATDLVLANSGPIDAAMPGVRVLAGACDAADGANGFTARAERDGWRFVAPPAVTLRAGRARRIGWLHCGNVQKVEIDENQ